MAIIKKILSHPLFKMIFGSKVGRTIVFILFCIAPMFLIWKWWKKKKKSADGEPEEERKLAPKELLKIYKEFKKQIPKEFRRSILLYQPVVVFGEAGTGKTQLIDNYTDWQGQAYQFYPSYTLDPTLQFYLGSQVLVQEVPSPLLNDTSQEARNALINLWEPMFIKKEPVITCTLKATSLASMTPDSLRRQAQMIRGKINIITRIRKEPVKVHVVVTHMDQLEGYQEFAQFLQHNSIPLMSSFDSHTNIEELKHCLSPYERYLPLALTTLPSGDYKSILNFFHNAPDTFSSMFIFLQTLRENDPLSFTPEIGNIYFTSNTITSEVSNPFESALDPDLFPKDHNPLFKHRVAAVALALIGLFYFVFAYQYEQHMLHEVTTAMDEFKKKPNDTWIKNQAQEKMYKFIRRDEQDRLLQFLPSFISNWPEQEQEIRNQFVKVIRDYELLPALERAKQSANPHEKTLYILALLYASKNNGLGETIKKRIKEWSNNLGLRQELIREYIDNSEDSWVKKIKVEELPKYERTLSPAHKRQLWLVYFLELERAYQKSYITQNYLQELQESTKILQNAIAEVKYFLSVQQIYKLLENQGLDLTVFETYLDKFQMTDWIRDNQEDLQDLLPLIQQSTITTLGVQDMNLRQLVNNLKAMEKLGEGLYRTLKFTLVQQFKFNPRNWEKLIQKSKIRLLINRFISQNQNSKGQIFFTKHSYFPDIKMNPNNQGTVLFLGSGKIPGRYTHQAFNREVKPVLEELTKVMKALSISDSDKRRLENFILDEVNKYAYDYANYTKSYYQQFDVKSNSVGALRIILSKMVQPTSPFNDFMENIRKNTALEESSSPYLQPMYKFLSQFQYVNRVMASNKGSFPELEKYKDILKQILLELEGLESEDKKGKKEKKEEAPAEDSGEQKIDPFQENLTAKGRLAYKIFVGSRSSYLSLTREWLDSVGLIKEWQKPFLAPIYELYKLGKSEIEDNVKKSWENRLWPQILPIITKFPFNSKSKKSVTPLEMENVLHPTNGTFWPAFQQLVVPVLVKRGGKWRERAPFRGERLKLPKNMLIIVNHMARVSKALWDKEGNPQPLVLQIKPNILPTRQLEQKNVILAYLQSGKTSLFAFNQRPAWREFKINWWEQETSKVGIQLHDTKFRKKAFLQIPVSDQLWSFHRLLKKGRVLRRNIWTWLLPEGVTQSQALKIKFTLRSDPWDLFEIPGWNRKR